MAARHDAVLAGRFGLGPRLGDDPAARRDVAAAIERDIARGGRLPPGAEALPTSAAALAENGEFQPEERRVAAQKERETAEKAAADAIEAARRAGQRPPPGYQPPAARIFRDEIAYRLRAAMEADLGFTERLVWFWSNHFAVAVAKGDQLRLTAGAFEREAIRPHVHGSFRAMLKAVEQHPAMLIYLDNRQSIGPASRAGQRRGRGLNENLARELLELHTLGVNGGYSQADVTSLARAITGWTVPGRFDDDAEMGAFFFNANRHEPGAKTVLGRTYPDAGLAQGEAILDDLARHPATARHIATKLARHFIADDPPADLVARLAKVFRDTDGNLAALSRALLAASAAYPEPRKLRQPIDFAVAALRMTGRPAEPGQVLFVTQLLGQPIWNPPGPNGFPDTDAQWATPDGLKVRLEAAMTFARQTPGAANPLAILDATLGPACSANTRQAVARAESRPQGLAILLMSPEVQRR
ncbi:DUF1800 family protein [Phreatobacter sp.]|uniref:DUF1800 domain-containing protein n=1 Tax=Phreatobacter sp. TaxID=1966341 RepID=UPI0022C30F64|nr:DUF1800 family protein [Phreatobacter sp.]MCZ8315703.1 DUF1800 family protein [Phreatobacter sp.]